MSIRGHIEQLRTIELAAAAGTPNEIIVPGGTVAIYASFASAIKWTYAESSAKAVVNFAGDKYFVYRGANQQYEIPPGKGNLYIEALTGSAVAGGLSIGILKGSDAT